MREEPKTLPLAEFVSEEDNGTWYVDGYVLSEGTRTIYPETRWEPKCVDDNYYYGEADLERDLKKMGVIATIKDYEIKEFEAA